MERKITSLALVKAVYSQFEFKRDYIENFVPFIANLLRKRAIKEIALDKLDDTCGAFRDEFGLNIPYLPMLTILQRCKKRGLFKQEHGRLITITEAISNHDFGDIVVQKESKINELLDSIVEYAKHAFSVTISKDEAQNTLLNYLSSHDMDIIFATQGDSILPGTKVSPNLKYIFGKYIISVKDSNVAMFNLISEVAIGHILVNTILYADKLQKYSSKFKGLRFYLDVRFVFRLLGYEGDLFRTAYQELLLALREQEAELCIFSHNYDEILGVLRGATKYIDAPDYNPTQASSVLRYYRDSGKNNADIQHDIATIDEHMKNYGICIVPAPEFSKTEDRQIEEKTLQESINRVYSSRSASFDPDEKRMTIEKDIKSIASIYHLRKIIRPLTIRQAQCFFLTSNSGLAYASRSYELQELSGENMIPACITDVFVGTLVWMQSPVRWAEINKKRFLADCMALLTPSPAFIKKLVDEAKKLKDNNAINDDEFMVVRSSMYVQQILMERTYGNPDSINSDSITDVIDRIRAESTAPLIDKIQHKDSELMVLQHENEENRIRGQNYREQLEGIAVREAKSFTNNLCIVVWVFFALSLLVSLSWSFPFQIFLYILAACFALAGFGFGVDMKKIRTIVFSRRLSVLRQKYGIKD